MQTGGQSKITYIGAEKLENIVCKASLHKIISKKRSLWYNVYMSKTGNYILGRNSFEKISAIEGVHLSPEMKRQFAEFDRKGLSASERLRALVQGYGKKR